MGHQMILVQQEHQLLFYVLHEVIDYLRLKKIYICFFSLDLSELGTLPPTCQVTYPNPDDLLHFTLTITPDDVNILLK